MNPHLTLNQFLPPFVYKILNKIKNELSEEIHLKGPYLSWADAKEMSTGYDKDLILEKTKSALIKVKTGEAVYERDSVLFDEIQYSWPLLSGLMWVAAQSGGKLNVIDFGGSLGSTYFQNRIFLNRIPSLQWNIIEQIHYVMTGKQQFEDEFLKFYSSIDECLNENNPNVIILSSVLQYLEDPILLFNKLSKISVKYLIIERTPFYNGNKDLLFVQKIPSSIYAASYPIWVFSKDLFLEMVKNNRWEIVSDFSSLDNLKNPVNAKWLGMILTHK